MKIIFQNHPHQPLPLGEITLLKQVISAGLKFHNINKHSQLSITLVSPEEIQALNSRYRKKDSPTDVLSFPTGHVVYGGAENGKRNRKRNKKNQAKHQPPNLGDIIICLAVAKDQGESLGHSLQRELAFLTAHGFLHLIGYDHQTQPEEDEMIHCQNQMLNYMGITR